MNGLVSFDKKSQENNINLIRPLLDFSKKDLVNITKKVFSAYVEDPTNENEKYSRVKIRKLLKHFKNEGLDLDKFNLTIKNLKFANKSINFYIKKNLDENSITNHQTKAVILNKDFFNH